jgi:hypothetical protein
VSSGGRFSGERTHQPYFLIGLHDLTFFSVEVRPSIKQCRVLSPFRAAIQQRFFSKPYERPTAPLIQPEFVENSMTIVKTTALQFWPFLTARLTFGSWEWNDCSPSA